MGPTRNMQPKFRRRRQLAAALAIALVVLLIGTCAYVWYQRDVVAVRDYEGEGNGNVVMVRVGPGDSVDSLSEQLVEKDVVGSRRALMSAAERKEPELQAGYYPLQEQMSADKALEWLSSDERRRGVVDIPNSCATLWLPTQIFDFDINPSAAGPIKHLDGSIDLPIAQDK